MLYVSGQNFSPTQIMDFEIWLFYCRKPIFWRAAESSHPKEGYSATMLNRRTLEKDKVTIVKN
jgi:hypothetical protein